MDETKTSYILAFDTSIPKGKCAVLCPNGNEEEVLLFEEFRISKTLLPQVEQLLNSRNIDTNMIQAIGVSVGPGAFTGLRVGLSCAKGLSLGLGCPLYGFSSLETMAMAALLNEMRAARSLPDYILPYRDARYGELFTALFEVSRNPELPRGNVLSRIQEDEIIAQDEFQPPEDGHTLLTGQKVGLPKTFAIGVPGESFSHSEIDSSAVATAWLTQRALQNQMPSHSDKISLNYFRKSQAQTKWPDPQG